ncbi:MAG: DNA gyrase subunit A [Verrucomicrobiales bacterium]
MRARIEPGAKNILEIEIPFSTTTGSLVDSILKANDKGKIKIAHIDDMTAENVDIRIHLPAGADQETMIQALYTFTDCSVDRAERLRHLDNKPQFLPVSKLLKASAERTRDLPWSRIGSASCRKLHLASLEDIHRKPDLPRHRGMRDLGGGHGGDLEGDEAAPQGLPARGRRTRTSPG